MDALEIRQCTSRNVDKIEASLIHCSVVKPVVFTFGVKVVLSVAQMTNVFFFQRLPLSEEEQAAAQQLGCQTAKEMESLVEKVIRHRALVLQKLSPEQLTSEGLLWHLHTLSRVFQKWC